ncbi:MAG: S8 family serine peptidase, partial [Chitinophagaceae bacterium]
IDKTETGQDGHGLGTLSLLAGNKVTKDATFNEFEGYIGGAPLAEVIPMRLSESVVILNAENFCDALYYAIEKECEVVSMSMAGKPSGRMARAVNRAYEAGIVIVSAASNCWYKGPGALLPKCVMFPAAFERVIAATGAMYDHKPYDVDFIQQGRFNITTKYMQGSWGPPSRMHKALAAYTPNTPWASTKHSFLRSGGGTSSATPQVAAAAALWIAYHRDELEKKGYYSEGNKWKKVESVRNALYKSAAKDEVFKDWKKYYGNGILRAYDALMIGVPDESELKKAEKAESSFFGITELAGSLFANRRLFRSEGQKPEPDALAIELMHLLQTDPQFYDTFSKLDISDPAEVAKLSETEEFQNKVLKSPYASNYLKEAMAEGNAVVK